MVAGESISNVHYISSYLKLLQDHATLCPTLMQRALNVLPCMLLLHMLDLSNCLVTRWQMT
jgi:hypothetical protein